MCRFHDNLLVLNVTTPTLNDESVGCTIAVDVGFDNSLSDRAGLPHLLEHVISNWCQKLHPCDFSCTTYRFHTVYSFETTLHDHEKVLKIWADKLFSKHDLVGDDIENIIKTERWRVHNEFHEKRLRSVYGSAFEILKFCNIGTNFPQFGCGNINTLKGSETELLKELNELRQLYRQRPVVICTYSAHELDMETILNSFNVGDFSERKPPHTVQSPRNEDENTTKSIVPTSLNIKKPLIVATSQDDRRNLILIFPMMNKLNGQQTNTFNWIAEMIGWTTDGLLINKLRDYKLATLCEATLHDDNFFIFVHLTDQGLEQIQCVCDTVKSYLDFLCGQWMGDKISGAIEHMQREEKGLFNSQTHMKKSAYIATRLNGEIEEFDYDLLYSRLEGKPGQDFISEHLLENKNIAHMIYDRSPSDVLDVLMEECTDCFPSKQFQGKEYGIPFYMVNNLLLETNGDVYRLARFYLFMWMEFKPYPSQRSYYISLANPEHVAFNMLFQMHFHYCFSRYESIFKGTTVIVEDQWLTIQTGTMESYDVFKPTTWFTESEDKFSMVKQDKLADMSVTMSSSVTFAESLMETYIESANCKKPIYPIYELYKTLLNVNYEDYCGYCRQMINSTIPALDETQNINHEPFHGPFQMDSINSNDAVTTTLIFYQTSHLWNDLSLDGRQTDSALSVMHESFESVLQSVKMIEKLYTAEVAHQPYGNIDGFLCKILSVEQIHNYGHVNHIWRSVLFNVCQHINSKMVKEYNELNLQEVYKKIIERPPITVQVIGHTNPKINEETFEKQFEKWYISRHKYSSKN